MVKVRIALVVGTLGAAFFLPLTPAFAAEPTLKPGMVEIDPMSPRNADILRVGRDVVLKVWRAKAGKRPCLGDTGKIKVKTPPATKLRQPVVFETDEPGLLVRYSATDHTCTLIRQ